MPNSEDQQSNTASNQEFPWHEKTWQQYITARTQNQLPHAILLSGEEGIGKYSLSRRIAKSLICMNTATIPTDACNQCRSCKTFESGANPDFTQITLLEEKQQIGVDQIRSLSDFLHYSRSYNTNRVVILNPVERMNVNAANSLLKSLEEPADHTVIILVTAKMSQLLPTIKSRCQLFSVAAPSKDETILWLQQHQSHDKNNQIDPEILLEMSGTKPLKAIKLTQQDIENRNQFFQDLSAVINQQITITEAAKKWEKQDFETLLDWQILLVQNNIKTNLSVPLLSDDRTTSDAMITQHLTAEEHWHLYQNLIKQKQYIHTSVNPLMFLENMIMLWMKTI